MKLNPNGRGQKLLLAAFIIYIVALFYLVFMSQTYGRNSVEALRYNDMNLVPFKTISNYLRAWERQLVNPSVVITNIFGNIVAFIPFGLLGPLIDPRLKKAKVICLWAFLLSLFIEVGQALLAVGVFDVDDLILNFTGGVIGYIVYKTIDFKHIKSPKKVMGKKC